MTINKAMEQAARVRSDAFDDETKAGWLLELEGRIREEVIRTHEREDGEGQEPAEPVLSFPEDADKVLLVGPPYERLYELYLLCQIDLHNGETDRYANSVQVFNAALDAWAQAYHRRHMPTPARYFRNVF